MKIINKLIALSGSFVMLFSVSMLGVSSATPLSQTAKNIPGINVFAYYGPLKPTGKVGQDFTVYNGSTWVTCSRQECGFFYHGPKNLSMLYYKYEKFVSAEADYKAADGTFVQEAWTGGDLPLTTTVTVSGQQEQATLYDVGVNLYNSNYPVPN